MGALRAVFLALYIAVLFGFGHSRNSEEERAQAWLERYDVAANDMTNMVNAAQWAYNVNITDHNAQASAEADAELAEFQIQAARNASTFHRNQISDPKVKRLLEKIGRVGVKLNQTDALLLSKLVNSMTTVYSTGTICSWKNNAPDCSKMWTLDDLANLLQTSKDYDQLRYIWQAWQDATGRPIRNTYQQFVALSNMGAQADGFDDTGDWWRSWYEDPSFRQNVENLWRQVLPLYEQLHAYARKRLRQQYPGRFQTTAIPAHILGNMWAQQWEILDLLQPYPEQPSVDVTEAMKAQGYTAKRMFETADSFFESLGLMPMPDSFWANSMLERPKDGRNVVCHASAWDFSKNNDVRIKMCTQIQHDDFVTVHHEMGHCQYYLQYADQPNAFKNGANPGFHEAIGDTMALAVGTPKHLHAIGLLDEFTASPYQDMNFLLKQALSKIAFLPFGYLIDQWRWDVFDGTLDATNWNQGWWDLRYKYQGIVPPAPRSADDFDPGAKFHIPSNTPYIRYFVANIVQFQFFEALCTAAGHQGPLHMCDFYNSKAAGELLANMMRSGSSRPWPEVMQEVTGQPNMSAAAMIKYFEPLMNYLMGSTVGECFGWGYEWPKDWQLAQPRCTASVQDEPARAQQYLQDYNQNASLVYNDFVKAEWNYWTNITDYNQELSAQATTAKALFDQAESVVAQTFDLTQITDYYDHRQLEKIAAVGQVLSASDTYTLNQLVNNMTNLYSEGQVCNYTLYLRNQCDQYPKTDTSAWWLDDPQIGDVFATSRDYDELAYTWLKWRDVTGVQMRPLYQQYIELMNKGAQAGGFADAGAWWRSWYEDDTFQQQVQNLFAQVLPLYEQLHTYVRRKLIQQYSGRFSTSAIPAHLLGNEWAQAWSNIFDFTQPYPDQPSVDVSDTMVKQGYTPTRMFLTAQDFFESIGFAPLPTSFWNLSMIVRPADGRPVDCYADSEDFFNSKDFGIKMCTSVDMDDLITIHHEMGHIQYFISYSQQPIPFREGANPGFHEAIGDTMALSASTLIHLKKIGLLPSYVPSDDITEIDINFLYKTALDKIAFLPFGYLIDQYRWKLFDGTISLDEMNAGWWSQRYQYEGLVPPDGIQARAHNETLFDAGSKFHVASNVPYIRYFVSYVIQFQFFQALCDAAGHTGPLHKCDFYNSTAAGNKLINMLKMGYSRPWPDAMQALTGQRKMLADAILNYFKPLMDYLKAENTKAGDCYGWGFPWPFEYNLQEPRCNVTLGPVEPVGPTATSSPGTDYCNENVDISGFQQTSAVTRAQLCAPYGQCKNTPSGAYCECDFGFTGEFCEQADSNQVEVVPRCAVFNTSEVWAAKVPLTCPEGKSCLPHNSACLVVKCHDPLGYCLNLREAVGYYLNNNRRLSFYATTEVLRRKNLSLKPRFD